MALTRKIGVCLLLLIAVGVVVGAYPLKTMIWSRSSDSDAYYASLVAKERKWPKEVVDEIPYAFSSRPHNIPWDLKAAERTSISPTGTPGGYGHEVIYKDTLGSSTPQAVIQYRGRLYIILLFHEQEKGWRVFLTKEVPYIRVQPTTEPSRPRRFSLCFLNALNVLSSPSVNSESITHVYKKGS